MASHFNAAAREAISSTERAPSENCVWMCVSTLSQTPCPCHGISRINAAAVFCALSWDHDTATTQTINAPANCFIAPLLPRVGVRQHVELRDDVVRDVKLRRRPHEDVGIHDDVDAALRGDFG